MKRLIGFGIILLLCLWCGYNYYLKYIDMIKREEQYTYYLETKDNYKKFIDNGSNQYDYVALLEIPEIDLHQGLLSINNPFNNVDYNIMVLKESTEPDTVNSNVILASHNGNSRVSFFRDLEKLNIGSQVYIYYKGIKYKYLIEDIYVIEKTGMGNIRRNKYRKTITLITCKNNSDTEQIVFIGYLDSKEEY